MKVLAMSISIKFVEPLKLQYKTKESSAQIIKGGVCVGVLLM